MSGLGPDARSVLAAARDGDEPSFDDEARLRAKIGARIAAATVGTATALGANTTAAATAGAGGAGTAAVASTVSLTTKVLLAIVITGGTAGMTVVAAQTNHAPSAPAPASAPASASASASAPASAPAPASASASASAPAPSPFPPSPPPDRPPPTWLLGAAFDLLAVGTTPVPRASFVTRYAWKSGGSLGIALSFADGSTTSTAGNARLLWATATLDACPLRWSLTRSISLSPCVPIEGGVLSVGGDNVENASTHVRSWLTVGAMARLEVLLGGRLFAEARGGLALPLVRDTFYFLPATDVYQPPILAGWAGIAAGVTFP